MPRAEEPFRDAASLFFGCRFICSALINSLWWMPRQPLPLAALRQERQSKRQSNSNSIGKSFDLSTFRWPCRIAPPQTPFWVERETSWRPSCRLVGAACSQAAFKAREQSFCWRQWRRTRRESFPQSAQIVPDRKLKLPSCHAAKLQCHTGKFNQLSLRARNYCTYSKFPVVPLNTCKFPSISPRNATTQAALSAAR